MSFLDEGNVINIAVSRNMDFRLKYIARVEEARTRITADYKDETVTKAINGAINELKRKLRNHVDALEAGI